MPARYDLNEIPCEIHSSSNEGVQWLDPVNSVPEELWTEVHNIVQKVVIKTMPKKKKSKKAKWLSEEASQIKE